jgi:hypothetical protein
MATESLYTISSQYQDSFRDLTEILSDTEMSAEEIEQTVINTLTDLEGEFKNKALNVAAYTCNLALEAESIDVVIKRLTARRDAVKRKHENFKNYLFNQMLLTNISAIKNEQLELTIKNNPAKVIINDEDAVPANYKTIVSEVKISKSAIAKDIKAGIMVTGVEMVSSKRLDIK